MPLAASSPGPRTAPPDVDSPGETTWLPLSVAGLVPEDDGFEPVLVPPDPAAPVPEPAVDPADDDPDSSLADEGEVPLVGLGVPFVELEAAAFFFGVLAFGVAEDFRAGVVSSRRDVGGRSGSWLADW